MTNLYFEIVRRSTGGFRAINDQNGDQVAIIASSRKGLLFKDIEGKILFNIKNLKIFDSNNSLMGKIQDYSRFLIQIKVGKKVVLKTVRENKTQIFNNQGLVVADVKLSYDNNKIEVTLKQESEILFVLALAFYIFKIS